MPLTSIGNYGLAMTNGRRLATTGPGQHPFQDQLAQSERVRSRTGGTSSIQTIADAQAMATTTSHTQSNKHVIHHLFASTPETQTPPWEGLTLTGDISRPMPRWEALLIANHATRTWALNRHRQK